MKTIFSIALLIFALQLAAQPANNECSTSVVVTPSAIGVIPTYVNGTLLNATHSAVYVCTGNNLVDVWYKFTATGKSTRIFVKPTTSTDLTRYYFNVMANCNGTNLISCESPLVRTGGQVYADLHQLTVGTVYYVRVYYINISVPTDKTFSVAAQNITLPAVPANDDCNGAVTITPSPTCVSTAGTTTAATQSLAGCIGNANDDVWYSFMATETSHTITATGTSFKFDMGIQLLNGCPPSTSLYCNDDYYEASATINASNLTIGNIYKIRVYDANPGYAIDGTFGICVIGASTTLVNEATTMGSFSVFPNPSDGNITIDLMSANSRGKLLIQNSTGTEVFNKDINGNSILKVDLNEKPGIYLIQFSDLSGNVLKSEKLIIE